MPIASTGLTRISVTMLDRRLDVALPDDVAVTELLPVLIRHASDNLADVGVAHGGWTLRRADGSALPGAKGLADHGVRDGDVLALVHADTAWPEPEYDDIVDAIAASRRYGQPWSSETTRSVAVAIAACALIVSLAALARSGQQWTVSAALIAAGLSTVLLAGGVVASRAGGDTRMAVVCGALAMPYAFVVGLIVGHAAPAGLLVGSAAMATAGLLAIAGIGRASAVLIAGVTSGLVGIAGSVVAGSFSAGSAAAVVLAGLALGTGLVPAVAITLAGLARWEVNSDIDRLAVAVARADEMIVGLWLGTAVAAGVAVTVIAAGGDGWVRWLATACAGVLGFRARAYAAMRQRATTLLAAAAVGLPLLASVVWIGPAHLAVAGALAATSLLIITVAAVMRRTPYLARAGDLVEAACALSVLPLLCGALGLYARLRALT